MANEVTSDRRAHLVAARGRRVGQQPDRPRASEHAAVLQGYQTSTLDLTSADGTGLEQLLAGEKVRLAALVVVRASLHEGTPNRSINWRKL
jgi:hypothetical protein